MLLPNLQVVMHYSNLKNIIIYFVKKLEIKPSKPFFVNWLGPGENYGL